MFVERLRGIVALSAAALIAGCAHHASPLPDAVDRLGAQARVELADVPFFPQQDYQCGPAALAAALRYSGSTVTPEDLAPQVYLPGKEGSLPIEMTAAVRRHDRIAYTVQPELLALLAELQAGHPVVVFQNLGLASLPVWHFAVLIGYSKQDDDVVLRSGRDERRTMSAHEFLRTWELGGRWALVVLRPGQLPGTDDPDGYLRAIAATEAVRGASGLADAYLAAVRRWPDNTVARFGYANALQASGQVRDAIEQYRTLIAQHPGQVAALNNLADALNRQGCRAEALAVIDRALAEGGTGPLREVLEQTRREILTAAGGEVEPATCAAQG